MSSVPNYLILGGVGRSGTTALRCSFGLHPDVYYNGKENNSVQDIVACASRNGPGGFRAQNNVVDDDKYYATYRRLIDDLVWPDAELRSSKSCWMCAINPQPDIMPALREILPNAKMLYLVRNGIDLITSRQKYKSFQSAEFESHCRVWNRSVEMAAWVTENVDLAQLIRYEWFTQNETLRDRIDSACQFAELRTRHEVADNILGHRYHPTSGGKARRDWASASDQERNQITNAAAEKWAAWSPDQQQMFVELCGEGMSQLGYSIPD